MNAAGPVLAPSGVLWLPPLAGPHMLAVWTPGEWRGLVIQPALAALFPSGVFAAVVPRPT